jgi:hypothetical protein
LAQGQYLHTTGLNTSMKCLLAHSICRFDIKPSTIPNCSYWEQTPG